MFVIAVLNSGSEPDSGDLPEVEAEATTPITTTARREDTTTVPDVSTTPSVVVYLIPEYSIVEIEDVSFPGAVRISLRVTVEEGTTAGQLRALARGLASEFRESHQYQAFNVFFYHFPRLSNDIATLGRWEHVPFGDWSRAAEVERGDYSNHQEFDDLNEKDWSLLPTPAEVDIYLAYNETFDEMDTDPLQLPSDDDVFAAVAAARGISVKDVDSAIDTVFLWIFSST